MISTLYKTFQHWSEGGTVWILSDTHFDDEDCMLMDPTWPKSDELVRNINKFVNKQDTFILLGDVGNPKWIEKIHARYKVLIMGNHDKSRTKLEEYFDEVYDGPLFISDKILLSHEPVLLPFCLNIHGHDHNEREDYPEDCRHINLACNVCGFTPVNLSKLIKNGALANIKSIHRQTIDRAVVNKFITDLYEKLISCKKSND